MAEFKHIYTIELHGVTLGYGERKLVEGASVGFGWGELTALIGRNGTGKSTLLRTIASLARPQAGKITINGIDTADMTMKQIAQDYGMSAQALNKKLAEMRIQYSCNGQWILYAPYKDKGYVSSVTVDITRADGRPDVVLHTEWTQAGRKFLYEELKKEGIIPMLER
ncbi:MAG: phage antirepressor KilAC domain-containing protein [Tidjanibacter sp.]|nr:phage antirepressor KilAC domain-containing protein [Tidjanibacter sp.]